MEKNTSEFKTPYNAKPYAGFRITTPSQTMPDQTMSIRQLLNRQAQGLSLGSNLRVGNYEEELLDGMTQSEFQRLDLADQERIIAERHQEVEDIKQRARAKARQVQELEQQKRQKAIADARDEHRRRREGESQTPGVKPGDRTNHP